MQEEHRVNENTHTKINVQYLTEVFFGKHYIGLIGDCFNILIAIIYFRTLNLINNYDQILIQKSLIALLFIHVQHY
jgi:hypothetical protein